MKVEIHTQGTIRQSEDSALKFHLNLHRDTDTHTTLISCIVLGCHIMVQMEPMIDMNNVMQINLVNKTQKEPDAF